MSASIYGLFDQVKMFNTNFSSSLKALFRLKTRLLLNTFLNWKSVGKITTAILALCITSYVMAAGASDLVFTVQAIPFGEYLLEWILGLISLYLIIVVFTGDLLTGHSLNTGQMSSDYGYLISLPIPAPSLILIKLFERLLTDYIGLLLLLSGILGIILRNGLDLAALLAGLVIYLQISLIVGLAINLMTIAMKRLFRTSSINNFFSLLGYISAFLTICPYLVLSNFPAQSLAWLIEYSDSFTSPLFKALEPLRWLASSLINGGNCREFIWWSAFWLLIMIFGCVLFYVMIRLNWLTVSHSAARKSGGRQKRWLTGFLQKEMLLLRSDFNVLINAIFMPVTIIALEIYFFRNAFNFTGSTQLLNMICGAIIYFCMFGPINAIGAEGRSISIIESLPITAGEFIFRKFVFWLLIAGSLFIPASIIGFNYLGYKIVFNNIFYIFFFTSACVWISVSISAIFANYEGKILQQRSTLSGKFAALALMFLAAPIKEIDSLSSYNLLVLTLALILVRQIAIQHLQNRLDQENSPVGPQKLLPYVLLAIVFLGAEVAIIQFFRSVIPGQDTGLWSWILASVFFLPAMITFCGRAVSSPNSKPLLRRAFRKPEAKELILTTILCVSAFFATNMAIGTFPDPFIRIADNVRALIYTLAEISAPTLNQLSQQSFVSRIISMISLSNWFVLMLAYLTVLVAFFEAAFRTILLAPWQAPESGSKTTRVVLSIIATATFVPRETLLFGFIAAFVSVLIHDRLQWWPANWLIMSSIAISAFTSLIFL